MAKNYTPKELFDVIVDGTDIEALTDIGRRYPLLSVKLAKLDHVAAPVSEVLAALPNYLTARKLEKTLRGGAPEASDEVEADTEVETDPEAEQEVVEEKQAPKKRGRKPKVESVEAEPDPKEEAESEGGKYDGIPAPKLFQECKKRGIKAAPKKPAEFYVKLLEEADAAGSASEDDGDEDWDI